MSDKKPKIVLHPVVSSNISFAGYDEDTEELQIVFKNGAKYTYEKVPKAIYKGIFSAESAGLYFRNVISKSYKFKKL